MSPPLPLGRISATTALLAVLAGCGGAPAPVRPDGERIRQFSARGYLLDDQHSLATSFATWNYGGKPFDIAVTKPAAGTDFPVVLYMPGLGQSRLAGEAWRSTWAKAGYGVVAFQPLGEDAFALAGRGPRNDGAAYARLRYAPDHVTARVQSLHWLLGEIDRRRQQGDPLVKGFDTSRVIVAGFDLGAYTALAFAGETVKDAALPPPPPSLIAAIALSPFADFSGLPFDQRYGAIKVPVLSVTGDGDADPYGMVSTTALREAPFKNLSATAGSYLLSLSRVGHATFGGGNEEHSSQADAGETETRRPSSGTTERRGEGRGEGSRGDGRRGAGQQGASSMDRAPAPQIERPQDPVAVVTERGIGIAAIQGVTTAFLDINAKQDAIAKEWLSRNARRWLATVGKLSDRP